MRAGLLKEVITIFKPVSERNDAGEEVVTYEEGFSCRAYAKKTVHDRTEEHNETVFPQEKEFVVRIYQNISELDRVEHEGKMYRILSVDSDKDLQQTTIRAELVND